MSPPLKIKALFSSFRFKKWPSKNQWRQFLKVLTKKEKVVFFVFLIFGLVSFSFLGLNLYFKNTEIQPTLGGVFTEGVIDHPRFINPIYASSDVDRDLVQLTFSGLMKYNGQGQIVPDLVQNYEVKKEGEVYEFYLKENVLWQDEVPLTADDVIFTIKTIQDSDYKSPFRADWVGIEVEKINDLGVRFKLKDPYSAFLENLTIKIIPEHIWQDISPQSFPLVVYNLKPVGSGPYKLIEIKQDELGFIKSITLVQNPKYFDKKPYLSKINFLFFDEEEELIRAANRGEINGFTLNNPKNLEKINNRWEVYYLSLPRYFAVFFNPDKSRALSEKEVRIALNYGTDKKEIIDEVLNGYGKIIDSPILSEIYGFTSPSKIYEFDIEKAKEVLDEAGFLVKENGKREKIIKKEPAFQFKSNLKLGSRGKEVEELQKCLAKDSEVYPEGEITGYFGQKTKEAVIRFQEKYAEDILDPWGFKEGTGLVSKTTRAKLNEICAPPPEEILPLKFSLITVAQSTLEEVANLLKNQWEALGAEIELKRVDISQLEKDFIKTRGYEGLLFGEVLGLIPDPFPFWHSSQKKDPGLNLAIYENGTADQLLEEARESLDPEIRAEKLATFQDVLIEDAPVIFLYSPDYLYLVSKEIKGIDTKLIADPSKRFSGIENWHIKTKRAWK